MSNFRRAGRLSLLIIQARRQQRQIPQSCTSRRLLRRLGASRFHSSFRKSANGLGIDRIDIGPARAVALPTCETSRNCARWAAWLYVSELVCSVPTRPPQHRMGVPCAAPPILPLRVEDKSPGRVPLDAARRQTQSIPLSIISQLPRAYTSGSLSRLLGSKARSRSGNKQEFHPYRDFCGARAHSVLTVKHSSLGFCLHRPQSGPGHRFTKVSGHPLET